ncbi:Spo11/DNA topoisomerase VI, subunit A [Corchorus olitorius]|uniref:Spo11/DNA topoisomerase VI, subunit A n=1 Tax=Corchorus olitorius TaxID=93759 RepID=A0A1R3KG55_9ROSI|nr:Spo11/DNA topoisomerase VI, subunit A [Corchorus olitorius]
MDDLCNSSMKFFSDQKLCYADILPPYEVRARIQVAVLNFLKILNSPDPSISDLPLVMAMCFEILVQEKRVTQRELFYKLLCDSPDYFSSQLQEPNKEAVDCSACGSSGYAISGDLELLESLVMKTDARYIIVVEKHAIFQRLAEDRVFNQIPSILLTAKGYPDIATRFLLHRMSRAFPDLPILALVDWNPAGLAILCTFKFGSIGMGLEAYRYACNVKWLGVRGADLQLIPEQSLAPLKPRDWQIAKSLKSSEILQENYREELELMMQSGQRAEIEALYVHGFDYLGKYIAKKIVQANYI